MSFKLSSLTREHKLGIIGCGWIGHVHAEALSMLANVQVVACSSRTIETAKSLGDRFRIENCYSNHQKVIDHPEVETVIIGTPNYQHAQLSLAALKAGKNVIIEKPLAMNFQECNEILRALEISSGLLAYAEELCFVPKYVEAKSLADEGKLGKIFHLKQIEKHDGPHSPWFFDPALAGGGVTLDLGVHSIEFARWFFGKPKIKSVWAEMATFVHKSPLEDHVIIHLEFENCSTALIESSWTLQGGMESKTEIHGEKGVLYVDLLQEGMGTKMYQKNQGWSFPSNQWNFQNGYPQELAHFLEAFENGRSPEEGVRDGLEVMRIVSACYESARKGCKIHFPYDPPNVKKLLDLWKPN